MSQKANSVEQKVNILSYNPGLKTEFHISCSNLPKTILDFAKLNVLPNFLPQPSTFFTRIYPPYPWHFATLASVQSVGQCPVPPAPAPATPRLMALLAVALQPLFWGHLFVRILQTAVVPFNLMHHQPTSSCLALQWLQNVCKASPPNVFRVFYV